MKVVPTSFSLSTSIVPFISSTMLFVIGMPRPVEPYLLVVELSSCENGSKMFGRYSLLMPMPVSFMVNRRVDFPSSFATSSTIKVTVPPSGVNLTAFPRILIMT